MTVEFRAQVYTGVRPQNELQLDFLPWSSAGVALYTRPAPGAVSLGCAGLGIMQSYNTVEAVLEHYPGGVFTQVVLASGAGNCTPGFLPSFVVTKTIGPLRLGVTIEEDSGSGSQTLRYRWFFDAATTVTWNVGGTTVRIDAYADPPTPRPRELLLQFNHPGYSTFGGATSGPATFSHVKLSAFTGNGVSLAHAAVEITPAEQTAIAFNLNVGRAFGALFRYTGDLDAIDADGTAEAADATYHGAQTCPAIVTVTEDAFWEGGTISAVAALATVEKTHAVASLADPWLSAQTVRPYATDRDFGQEGNEPLNPDNTSPTTWNAGALTVTGSLSVLRSTNAWTVDIGSVTIGGTATVPTFNVTVAPWRVVRDLRSHWRNWNNPANPDGLYQSGDLYTATKRDAYAVDANVPDAWGWSLYGYLDVDLTAPAGSAETITLMVRYAVRREGGTIETFDATYPSLSFPAGARNTRRVDLLISTNAGRPIYAERVDLITLTGTQTGLHTLHALNLVTAEQPYAKLGGKAYTLRDLSHLQGGITLACDGSFPAAHWGDDVLFSDGLDVDADGYFDHKGDHQNGIFRIENSGLLVAAQSGCGKAPGSFQATLSEFFTHLNRMEGLTATYSAAAIDAAFTDGTNTLGTDEIGSAVTVTRKASWLQPTMPHVRLTAGVAYTVLARLLVDAVTFPNGTTHAQQRFYQRNRLGSVLEALALNADSSDRAAAAATVAARAMLGGAAAETDPTLASGTTDASGFVTVPIRNGEYKVSSGVYVDGAAYLKG